MEKEENRWLKLKISSDISMKDVISEILVGEFDAAVELKEEEDRKEINAFFKKKNLSPVQLDEMVKAVSRRMESIAEIFEKPTPVIEVGGVSEEDWENSWKEFFVPFQVIDGVTVVPTWEDYISRGGGENILRMDPGMAFGTGHHATTSLCLQLISDEINDLSVDKFDVLDVGTGTGILAMGAVLLGDCIVRGIDNDQQAVDIARSNVTLNNMDDKIIISGKDLKEIEGKYDIVAANIIHDVLLLMQNDLIKRLKKGGVLILSGILLGEQVENIKKRFTEAGLLFEKSLAKEEWGALLFRKV